VAVSYAATMTAAGKSGSRSSPRIRRSNSSADSLAAAAACGYEPSPALATTLMAISARVAGTAGWWTDRPGAGAV
jgi:hypothetical protein